VAEDLLEAGIVAAFTGRAGGTSSAPFATLNLALRVQDDLRRVLANRRRVATVLGLAGHPWALARQVHGATILHIRANPPGQDPPEPGPRLWWVLPGWVGADVEDGCAVDLSGQGPGVAGEAEDGGDPAAVGKDPAEVVLDPQREVEGGERRARGAAGPAGEGGDDPGLEQVLGHQDRGPWWFGVTGLWRPRPPGQRPLRRQRVSA